MTVVITRGGQQVKLSAEEVLNIGEAILYAFNSAETMWMGLVVAAELHKLTYMDDPAGAEADFLDLAKQAYTRAKGDLFSHLLHSPEGGALQ